MPWELIITSIVLLIGIYLVYRGAKYEQMKTWFLSNGLYKEFLELPKQGRLIFSFKHLKPEKCYAFAKTKIAIKKHLNKHSKKWQQ